MTGRRRTGRNLKGPHTGRLRGQRLLLQKDCFDMLYTRENAVKANGKIASMYFCDAVSTTIFAFLMAGMGTKAWRVGRWHVA